MACLSVTLKQAINLNYKWRSTQMTQNAGYTYTERVIESMNGR